MRIVEFKAHDEDIFYRFVDIGFCARDYYYINFYLPHEHEKKSGKVYFESYKAWFDNFRKESIGSKMIILNFYLSEYMGWNLSENSPQLEYFADVYGDKTFSVISNNLNYLLQFNEKWFIKYSNLFNGLDLGWPEDIDNLISERIGETEDEITEVKFEDGSSMKFLDSNDTICSFYVLESDFTLLKTEIETIINKFE